MPASGIDDTERDARELIVVRLRAQPRRLFWPALFLILIAGACGFFFNNLPAPFTNTLMFVVAAVLVLLLVIFPWWVWMRRRYIITTRRVIVRSGAFRRDYYELSHLRGYQMTLRRGPLQRLSGSGTITLDNGVDEPVKLRSVRDVSLVYETLNDQLERNQIIAHRHAQSGLIPIISADTA